jgi:lysophospholipase L1-like esterase
MKNTRWPVLLSVLALGLSVLARQCRRCAQWSRSTLPATRRWPRKLPQKRPETGWGEFLAVQFQPGTVAVDNRAKNGRSTRTFIEEGRWQALLDVTQPGDVVLIQFRA